MEYTIYDGNGYYVCGAIPENGIIPDEMIPEGGSVVEGLHGVDTMLVAGQVVPVSGDKAQELIDEQFAFLRLERNARLAACDWTQVPDAQVDQSAWAAYRQALRDLPANTTDPANPVWPSKPD